MKKNIVKLQENPKEIDLSYFDNYGGYNYSDSYRGYTIDPSTVVDSLVDSNVFLETILDAGCASGELVRDFRRLGIRAYGIEKNKDILKKCVIPKFCTAMDLRDMTDINDSSFDVVYCNSLMYLYPQEIIKILKEFYRICTEAVYLCNPFLEETSKKNFNDPSRVFLATKSWWNKQFTEAGFEKIADNIYRKV
jgi:ubiquinone/menaquinone biosynthesis C-methylase UbiE